MRLAVAMAVARKAAKTIRALAAWAYSQCCRRTSQLSGIVVQFAVAWLAGKIQTKNTARLAAISAADVEQVIAELSEEFGEAITANGNGNGAQHETQSLVSLEKRVVGVEKAMNITVNLLRQFIRSRENARKAM